MNDISETRAKNRLPLPREVRAAIGDRLRESLQPIVSEPIPDRFLKLLEELERKPSLDDVDGAFISLAVPTED